MSSPSGSPRRPRPRPLPIAYAAAARTPQLAVLFSHGLHSVSAADARGRALQPAGPRCERAVQRADRRPHPRRQQRPRRGRQRRRPAVTPLYNPLCACRTIAHRDRVASFGTDSLGTRTHTTATHAGKRAPSHSARCSLTLPYLMPPSLSPLSSLSPLPPLSFNTLPCPALCAGSTRGVTSKLTRMAPRLVRALYDFGGGSGPDELPFNEVRFLPYKTPLTQP